MSDEVIPEGGLPDGETMRVHERAVTLRSGSTVWLRRYTLDGAGTRRYLSDGRWCCQLGGPDRMYAVPQSTGAPAAWLYGTPYAFGTWAEALTAGREAEARVTAQRRRQAAAG